MSRQQPVRIVIVDDHETLRRTLSLYLEQYDQFELVGEAGNGREALEVCARSQPDVVLMDILMPVMDGIAATRAIRRDHPHVQVIGMSGMEHERLKQSALQAGVTTFLYKGTLDDCLAPAIYEAIRLD